MRQKIRSSKGFTLVEMLACVVILLLMGVVCSTGINLANNSYQVSLYESNSQMLESTLDSYLGDILRHATSVQTETDGDMVLYFTNESYQMYDGWISVSPREEDAGGMFIICRDRDTTPSLLVSGNVYAETLYVEGFTLHYDADTQLFTGTYVIKSMILDDMARECEFAYRAVAEN